MKARPSCPRAMKWSTIVRQFPILKPAHAGRPGFTYAHVTLNFAPCRSAADCINLLCG